MSRSYGRPCAGVTTSQSEKRDKKIWHSRYRHILKQLLHIGVEEAPSHREYSDPWGMSKDGKNRRNLGGPKIPK